MSGTDQASGRPAPPPYSPPPPTVPSSSAESPPGGPTAAWPVGQPGASVPLTAAQTRLRRTLGLRSLTARIVSGVALLVLVVLASVAAGTYVSLRSSLIARLDGQVRQTAAQNANYFAQCRPEYGATYGCPRPDGPSMTSKEWVALLQPNGRQAATISSGPIRQLNLTPAEAARVSANTRDVFSVHQDGQELRVTGQINDAGLLVVSGLSTNQIDQTLRVLIAREVAIGAAAVVVAVVATLYGVRFSLRRLRGVTDTAQDVAAELSPEGAGLDRRVQDADDETEVGQLATSFNTMLAAVESQFAARVESEERMRQFMADASHELRTPLTSIRGYAELARMQRDAGDTSEDNLGRIEFEGTRMSRLVEDLLVIARGDAEGSSRSNRELIDIDGLLGDAVSGSRAAFPDRRIGIAVNGDPHVIGDRDQLLRVVRNLINNSAVHTAPDRPIEVRGFNDQTGVVVQVVDGGPGLPADEAAHVFERFWRADKARTRARGGSGLGLSIVATIVRAHGGTVRFDSSVETGSIMTVTLPAAETGDDSD